MTTIATKTDAKRGLVVGQHTKYIVGHNAKSNAVGRKKRCRTCKTMLPWSAFDSYDYGWRRVRRNVCRQCEVERDTDHSVPVEEIDSAFGNWLAGFIDGEGSFVIAHGGGQYRCVFSLTLRADDHAILVEAQRRTGIGSVNQRNRAYGRGNDKPQSVWVVASLNDCVALTRILDAFPLRAKKHRDYEIWRKAVLHWQGRFRRPRVAWDEFAALKSELEAIRTYAAS